MFNRKSRKPFGVFIAGKQGDLIFALPVVKALQRKHGMVRLITSPLCVPLVPVLWEQPFLKDRIEVDERPYAITNNVTSPWYEFPKGQQGINLSIRPEWIEQRKCWTTLAAEVAGVELTESDYIALPSLIAHRAWYYSQLVHGKDGTPTGQMHPNTVVLAPEAETMPMLAMAVWQELAKALSKWFQVLIVGLKPDDSFAGHTDLRGLTTVASMAKILAESRMVISALSLPFHLARHSGVPNFLLSDTYEYHSFPVDTYYIAYTSKQLKDVVETGRRIAQYK